MRNNANQWGNSGNHNKPFQVRSWKCQVTNLWSSKFSQKSEPAALPQTRSHPVLVFLACLLQDLIHKLLFLSKTVQGWFGQASKQVTEYVQRWVGMRCDEASAHIRNICGCIREEQWPICLTCQAKRKRHAILFDDAVTVPATMVWLNWLPPVPLVTIPASTGNHCCKF